MHALVQQTIAPETAVKNVGADSRQLASYLYQMMSEYHGADHEAYCVEAMTQTFDALTARDEGIEAEVLREALVSLVAVARRYLPDYDEHPEIQKADAALSRRQG